VSLLPIHVLGSPILREETEPVTTFGHDLQQLIDDMFETMYAASGIGLAAPQVGRSERLAVVDVEGQRHVVINPEIVLREGRVRDEEACLSIPDIHGDVDRARRVIVKALDRTGAAYELEASDLLARCLQHEIDHLHGRLFIDYLSYLKRRSALAKWEELREQYPDGVRFLKAGQQEPVDPAHPEPGM
jgi:peptide deformylase